jgi:hypothetical protein
MKSIAVSRITSRLAAIAAGSTVAVLAATGVAQANPAYKYVKPYQRAAALAPNITDIEAVFTSTQPSADPLNPFSGTRGIASYGDAIMSSAGTGLGQAVDASQVYSDRRYPGNAPFNAGEADNTGVEIGVNDLQKTVSVSLVLDSFGHQVITLKNPRVEDGMLVADGPGAGVGSPNALFTFALNEVNIPG